MWKKNGFIFLLSLIVGLVFGLFVIAWWLFPAPAENASISDLRTDIKIDYVKLVAASYADHGDIDVARARLDLLGNPPEVLELALAGSTESDRNQILQLQSHLLPISGVNTALEGNPTTSAIAIPPARNLLIGYGFLAACILALTFTGVRRQGKQERSAFRFFWRSSDMRKRIVILVLVVLIYRFTTNIPLTGINQEAARQAMGMTAEVHQGIGGFILSMDVLSGGTFSTFSILSVGIYGYIMAQILVGLIISMIPALQRRLDDDPREGRRLQARWNSWGSLLVSIPLSWLLLNLYSGKFAACMGQVASPPAIQFGVSNLLGTVTIMLELVAAAKFAEWLADQLSYCVRGMGPTLMIALGIVLGLMQTFHRVLAVQQPREIVVFVLLVVVLIAVAIYTIQARRNVPYMFTYKSQVFNSMRQGRVSRPIQPTLPLMAGMAGIAPVLGVQGLLTLPVFITVPLLCTDQLSWQAFATATGAFFDVSNPTYWLLFVLLLIPLTFAYNNVYLANQNYGQNLQHSRAQIPGVHSGQATERYLQRIMRVITLPYSLLLVAVTLLPYLTVRAFQLDISPMLGVSIFLLVGIVRDAYMNLEAELKLMGYEEKLLIG